MGPPGLVLHGGMDGSMTEQGQDVAADLRGLGDNGAFDFACFALDEVGAFEVTVDLAVDVQINAGRDIASDDHIRPQDRKGRMTRAGCHLSGHRG